VTQRQARRRRARRLVLDPLFVSAGNEHVKHALQASDSTSNAATHWGSAAAAGALPSWRGAKRRPLSVDTGLYQEHPRRATASSHDRSSRLRPAAKCPQFRNVPCVTARAAPLRASRRSRSHTRPQTHLDSPQTLHRKASRPPANLGERGLCSAQTSCPCPRPPQLPLPLWPGITVLQRIVSPKYLLATLL